MRKHSRPEALPQLLRYFEQLHTTFGVSRGMVTSKPFAMFLQFPHEFV